jgi:hypothetical protein
VSRYALLQSFFLPFIEIQVKICFIGLFINMTARLIKSIVRNRFCSLSCAASTKQKVDWDSINLIDLIENQKIPKTKIAEMMHCSDQAVNKRYKKLKEL